ncbi:golgin subfamily A member 2-like [Limulus polyphemus]|uniref:Golgin subfamily A member 2-like n=1 Tax=Limulus polyphemus TaxID=6850 RepID=A0ABM1T984_LIMPO|nr:golgin subfamily A member 2-like [Limulus polyphemus]XP_013784268.1 golgin subfamily A member 2-like [Limulus polyphemus]XP_022252440.1 golgin subfamily A member 2-like [Limulus polyphemus]XP_022252441.1 golgin subfamily A member 2-like [Limulus polyphemus]XP_022252442.1 golgin subfamily A member 2-like [Limulus polyphemus]
MLNAIKTRSSVLERNRNLSSTESLTQNTHQPNGLMCETHAFINGEIEPEVPLKSSNVELKRRNQQLAHLLEGHIQANEQLEYQLQELKAKISRAQREFERERRDLQEKAHRDQTTLKDQLQVHIQTIGILVAEKTELQSTVSQNQQTAKQKAVEIEELQGRLRASRQRVSDLERELSNVCSSTQQLEKSSKESSKELDRLRLENYKLSKSNEELKHQNSELAEKLNKKLVECQVQEKDLSNISSKLAMAELHIKQLSLSSETENPQQLEEVHRAKIDLEKKVTEYKESVQRLTTERDQMSKHYQDYVHKLSQELTSARDELNQAIAEKAALAKDKSSLSEKLELSEKTKKASQIRYQDAEELNRKLESLSTENEKLKKEIDCQVRDNAHISHLLEERESKLEELESALSRQQETQVDKTRLLETMQSEKVAASRAMAQNRQLKQQLEELQDGFVKLNDDKLKLTDELYHEQHISKELGERLSEQEEELSELKDQLSRKEKQLKILEQNANKETFQHHQIVDRMRHYEAQGHLTEVLQEDLVKAKERIETLLTQNTELRMALARQAEDVIKSGNETSVDKETDRKNDLVASLSASVRQLEMERDYLLHEMKDQQSQRDDLKSQMTDLNSNEKNVVLKEDHESLKNSMKQLEEKFTKTMDQIAELSDQKQQLEHLVTQLQGETDTIADYITLYQVQRGIMRKRASEKDEYIAQLARDREEMKARLSELQNLVLRLLEERKRLHDISVEVPPNSNHPGEMVLKVNGNNTEVLTDLHANVSDTKDNDDQTAKKILDLFTEIESSNLIEKPVLDTFHPCPVCSGRLLTV